MSKHIKIQVYPTDHFGKNGVEPKKLVELTGFLLPWSLATTTMHLDFKEMFHHWYKWGIYPIDGTYVNSEGIWKCPGDPDLYPAVKLERGDEICYFYQHALVAWFDSDGKLFATRMD